ncbi:hypothetical protein [Rubripirellula reticaptiva]|uniref:Uncharacterized protein n=1 Tax=Rubripirellula reticaptiva TaxID=2528013 RepID=A0A5C6F4U4_9BACT|nr:hypothetical protein [Rubripirellula reticaptiva]TWU55076.1 hypothetical protein Poly59_13690 [Rubripirellula reticaptiva]
MAHFHLPLATKTAIFAGLVLAIPADSRDAIGADAHPRQWVDQLGADSFHARESASQSLIATIVSGDEAGLLSRDEATNASEAVRNGLTNPVTEIRLACQDILRRADHIQLERQIHRLKNLRTAPDQIDLVGWDSFSSLIGDDQISRDLFADLTETFSKGIGNRERLSTAVGQWTRPNWDPYQISPDDELRWAMLIWMDIEDAGRKHRPLSSRITMSLSNPSMGPNCNSDQQTGLQRLIGRWIECQSSAPTARTHLIIAMRYACVEQATWLCERTLADSTSSASAEVTAMLTASVLGPTRIAPKDLEIQLRRRLADQRTAHVWQTVNNRVTKIRTQVRDVAIALLLRDRGIDPRDVGFAELQADQLFVYRDHSLGFGDETSRQAAHEIATSLINP